MHKIILYYGWWIVILGFLAQFMGIGISAYATSIFFQAMFSDLGWTRGDLSLSISIGNILAAAISPFVGYFVDKHGSKWVMAFSALATGICLILIGRVNNLPQAFIMFSLLAVFRVGFVSIPVMTMVANWFSEKKGFAMGIATAGQGMGGLLLSPLTTYLISNLGWRVSWGIEGILTCLVMIPTAVLIAKPRPDNLGLSSATKSSETVTAPKIVMDKKITPEHTYSWNLKVILRMPNFWLVAMLQVLYLFGHGAFFQHGFSLFTDKGITVMTAGMMMGMLGLFSLSGKIVLGYLSDRFTVRHVMMLALALAAVSILPLFIAEPSTGAWLFIGFWGFWECGVVALLPVLVATLFDKSVTGKMLGIFSLFTVTSQLIGPTFTGYVHDITGNYNLALIIFIIFYILSLTLVFFTRLPKLDVGN